MGYVSEMIRLYCFKLLAFVFSFLLFHQIVLNQASAEEYASYERTEAAVAHYARARALLVEALAEFEEARVIARPDMLIDPEEWRLSLVSRTEELNRILDPQPRVTRSGTRFKANKALIRRDTESPRTPSFAAKSSNVYAEEQEILANAESTSSEISAYQRFRIEEEQKAQEKLLEDRIKQLEAETDNQLEQLNADRNVNVNSDEVKKTEEISKNERHSEQADFAEDESFLDMREDSSDKIKQVDEVRDGALASKDSSVKEMSGEDEKIAKAIEDAIAKRLEKLKN